MSDMNTMIKDVDYVNSQREINPETPKKEYSISDAEIDAIWDA
jgi:hypothetical protein